jgi:zinc finger CCHC domain-containing protein 9
MTRFARAKGSKASNERLEEEATSWQDMKAQLKPPSKKSDSKIDVEDLDGDIVIGDEIPEDFNPDHEASFDDEQSEEESPKAIVNALVDIAEKAAPEPSERSKQRKRSQNNCLVCKKPGHLKKDCPELPEERRKELQDLVAMKIERKGKGTGRKKNKKRKLTEALDHADIVAKKQKVNEDTGAGADDKDDKTAKKANKKKKKKKSDKNYTNKIVKEETEETGAGEDDKDDKKKEKSDKNNTKTIVKKEAEDTGAGEDDKDDKTEKKKKKKKKKKKSDKNNTKKIVKEEKGAGKDDKDAAKIAKLKEKKKKDRLKQRQRQKDKAGKIVTNGEGMFQGFRVLDEDVKRLRSLHSTLTKDKTPVNEIKGVLIRERRRAERALAHATKNVCYQCRKSGHVLAQCPENHGDKKKNARPPPGVCYKCGAADHTSKNCESKLKGADAYRFASCFVCGQNGHLAKSCPDNPRGLYPKGGGCRFCGSVEHLKSDCTRKSEKDARTEIRADTVQTGNNIEVEVDKSYKKLKVEPAKKDAKVVSF